MAKEENMLDVSKGELREIVNKRIEFRRKQIDYALAQMNHCWALHHFGEKSIAEIEAQLSTLRELKVQADFIETAGEGAEALPV